MSAGDRPRIRVEHTGSIARVKLARPEKKNALDRRMCDELHAELSRLGADADTRLIALSADGPDFCAGADLEALAAMLDSSRELHLADAQALGRVFTTLRGLPKVVVAIVQGRALAGGAGLATACDIVLMHEAAEIGYPEVAVGFVPAMVMALLRRSVGEKRAFELVATGRRVNAREALDMGLATRVIPHERFQDAVSETLARLAAVPAEALWQTKRLFYELDGLDFGRGIALGAERNADARTTGEFRAGIRRFGSEREGPR
ncbi:MAG: enoyl-CoA hydratase/isomerase family protein [Gemmatimonadota bacterium]|nr:enoyl-CoA hydratase/isomerase family protein [Gemmatimonadota bacterium]